MSIKKLISVSLIVFLVALSLIGCGGDQKDTADSNKQETVVTNEGAKNEKESVSEKLDPVTLKIMVPGPRPEGMDEVIAEAERRMADTLNVKLNMIFVAWADLKQKLQVTLAAGDEVDLIFDNQENGMIEKVTAGYYEPLEPLLEKYGPNILATRSKSMMDANKIQGKTYALPLGAYNFLGKGYMIRQDIREKLGIEPIKTHEDLVKFMYAVKEKEPNVIPFTVPRDDLSLNAGMKLLTDYETHVRPTPLTYALPLYFKNNDGKVYNLFDEMDAKVEAAFKEYRTFFVDGIMHQDIMGVKSSRDVFISGKTAVIATNDFGVPANVTAKLVESVPGAKTEFVTFLDASQKKISGFLQWNFIAVPINSKHKERAIQFLNWANQKENYDLLAYGIEGKHWIAEGDDQYKPGPDAKKYRWFPYAWIWNPAQERLNATLPKEVNDMNRWAKDANNFIPDKTLGFSFDTAPVVNEIAQFNALIDQYYKPLALGVVDYDKTWAEFKSKAADITKKIQEEMQKQIDASLK
jgi:putative aldouronate transport system substrate-binding protein